MLTIRALKRSAGQKLVDAIALFRSKRYDTALYICGYALELALKTRVCSHFHWSDFPETRQEFGSNKKYGFLKTHDLDLLLAYTGIEDQIKDPQGNLKAHWDVVSSWNPEDRYSSTGQATLQEAQAAIESTRELLRILL